MLPFPVCCRTPNRRLSAKSFKLHKLFQKHAVLVPEELDEVAFMRQRYEAARRYQNGFLGLTVCPTLNCNFRCLYCYQHHPPGIMSASVEDRILRFIREQEPSVSSLSVTWFGGEPLLAFSVIENLSQKFLDIASGSLRYTSSIITNGYLLTPEISASLADLGVEDVQITLDGPRTSHNLRRPVSGGQETFDRILENIVLADKRLHIVIRINIDHENVLGIMELFDQLDAAGLRGRVRAYFSPVIPYTNLCKDVAEYCIHGQDWSKIEARLLLEAVNRGYGGLSLPVSRSHVCLADSTASWVIRPDGLLCRCWNDVTQPENAIGLLPGKERSRRMKRNLEEWDTWSAFNFPRCLECKVLPQCMGGCPYLGRRQINAGGRGYCTELRYNLPEILATYYLSYKRRMVSEDLLHKLHSYMPKIVPAPECR